MLLKNFPIGSRITLFCARYIYTGDLVGFEDGIIHLQNCGIVFETGPFSDGNWVDFQPFKKDHFICISAVESFGHVK